MQTTSSAHKALSTESIMTAPTGAKPTAQREVTITRIFDEPRALVFKM